MSTFTHVTNNLVIPENMFAKSPNLVSRRRSDVTGFCDTCGILEPIRCANGFMRRQCRCQRQEQHKAQSRQDAIVVGARCYTWLGKQAGDLADKTFDNFNPKAQAREALQFKQHLADARSYAVKIELGDTAGNLVFEGGYGVGKTHLACAILNRLRGERISGLFCTVQDFFDKLYASSMSDQYDLLDQASSTPVLVLDDLDKLYTSQQGGGEYQQGKLFTIINRRYLARLSTIITTNAEDDLSRWLNGATLSRLRERLTTLNMHGVDYRMRGNDTYK
jgi:DNA replication protein DnaC